MRILIAGLGLIGTSLALDLSAQGHDVAGYDPNPEHRALALQRGAVRSYARPSEGSYDRILLAAPPRASLELLAMPWQAPLWLDTGSVKQPICAEARQRRLPFVGGHPLAGNAGEGPAAARAGLFRGRGFALCPGGGPGDLAEEIVRSLGARPIWRDAAEHDRQVAASSHLCYAFSCALALTLEDLPRELIGPAAWEMLRVATSPTGLWQEILEMNGPAVAQARAALGDALTAAAGGDGAMLEAARAAAARLRQEARPDGG